jgi:K+-transporting ATPase KdpF subunit
MSGAALLSTISASNLLGLIVAIALFVYLLYALLRGERF